VLVRVATSSVNPVDNAIAGGMLRAMAEYEFPVILGRDFAGAVEGVGAGVSRHREGDTVLIVGATGGVGSFAVQLAVRAEAHVIATPSLRTTTTCASWAPTRSRTAAPMWLPAFAHATQTASTPCSTWRRTRRTSSRSTPPHSGTAGAPLRDLAGEHAQGKLAIAVG
jgi:hypothetical protein